MKKVFLVLSVNLCFFNLITAQKNIEIASIKDGVVGALHKPLKHSKKEKTVVYVMHAEQDYLSFPACTELSNRGYTVLCANNSASKTGKMNDLDFEDMMVDVAAGIEYLRKIKSIDKIVLLGHSGGGAMMAAYQNIAENGVSACNGNEKIAPCSDRLKDLPPADGIILLDANYGLSTMSLLSMNPAIIDENNPKQQDSALDLFSPANGFNTNGANYSEAFTKAFQKGIAQRMNKITQYALQRKKIIDNGETAFSDDEILVIPDANYVGFNNKFFSQDPKFLSHTSQKWDLIHKDGSITNEIVYTVRPAKNLKQQNNTFYKGALKTTVNRFLKTFAIRLDEQKFSYGADGFTGIDWDSSQTTPISSAKGIKVPSLTMGMTGNWEFLASEKIYLNLASKDKTLAFVEGAAHNISTCTQCEKTKGQYGDTIKTTFDFIAQWLNKKGRFQ